MDEIKLQDFPSLFSLKGKVAVITGSSRGLGLSAASAYDIPLEPLFSSPFHSAPK